jgi:hypothetical protein
MCYYSTTLRQSQFRDVREGEDLVLRDDNHGHHYPTGSDGKIVCMVPGSEVHIAELHLDREAPYRLRTDLRHLIGQPVSARFLERYRGGFAADRIVIEGHGVHLIYFALGTKFYTGPKRLDVAEKLGVNDRSITLDHMPPEPKPEGEETPAEPEAPVEPVQEPASDTPVAA